MIIMIIININNNIDDCHIPSQIPIGSKKNDDGTLSFNITIPNPARGQQAPSILDALSQAFASLQLFTAPDSSLIPLASKGGTHVRAASDGMPTRGIGAGAEWGGDLSWVMGKGQIGELKAPLSPTEFQRGPIGEVFVHRSAKNLLGTCF